MVATLASKTSAFGRIGSSPIIPKKNLEKIFKIVYNIFINEVEEFIKTFLNKNNLPRELEIQFANGFYYHFILMLKKPFNKSEIV